MNCFVVLACVVCVTIPDCCWVREGDGMLGRCVPTQYAIGKRFLEFYAFGLKSRHLCPPPGQLPTPRSSPPVPQNLFIPTAAPATLLPDSDAGVYETWLFVSLPFAFLGVLVCGMILVVAVHRFVRNRAGARQYDVRGVGGMRFTRRGLLRRDHQLEPVLPMWHVDGAALRHNVENDPEVNRDPVPDHLDHQNVAPAPPPPDQDENLGNVVVPPPVQIGEDEEDDAFFDAEDRVEEEEEEVDEAPPVPPEEVEEEQDDEAPAAPLEEADGEEIVAPAAPPGEEEEAEDDAARAAPAGEGDPDGEAEEGNENDIPLPEVRPRRRIAAAVERVGYWLRRRPFQNVLPRRTARRGRAPIWHDDYVME